MLRRLRDWTLYTALLLSACNGDNKDNTIITPKNNNPPIVKTVNLPDATQDQKYSFKIEAEDKDQDKLSYLISQKPSWLTIDQNGNITGTPTNNDVGTSNLELKISDGKEEVKKQFSIRIVNINDTPTAQDISVLNGTQDQQLQHQIQATDLDNDTLNYQVIQPSWLSIDVTGLLSGTPHNSNVGQNNLEVTISDGSAIITKTSTINVVNINDAPIVQDIPQLNATQDQSFSYQINAADIDLGDKLSFTLIKPSWLSIDQNGKITGTPGNNDVGNNDLEIIVKDFSNATITKTSKINVANVNDAPAIQTTSLPNATQGQAFSEQIIAIDIDGDKLIYTKVTGPAWISLDQNGKITGTPTNNDVGTSNLEIKVSDGTLNNTKQFTINVANVNDPPQITSQAITAATEGSNYSYQVQAADIDAGDVIDYFLTNNTNAVGISINRITGLISWSNAPSGNYNIEILAKDISGTEAKQNFTLTIDNTIHNLTGKITDTEGNGLAGIILNINSSQATITDFQGNYSINGLVTGNYSLSVGDNFTTVFNYFETINLTNDAAKNILLIKKLTILTTNNEYKNSLGNPTMLAFLKSMTATKTGQNTTFDRWKNTNLPVKVYLNQSDAESSAPGYDKITYDSNTGDIIDNAPNGINDYLDFARRAIKKWNDLTGINLFQEVTTQIGINGIGIDFEYTSQTVIPNAEGVTVKDVISLTEGFQYLRVQITDNHKIPIYDLDGNILGYVYKDFSGTILHELGHCLGLLHSQDNIYLMYLDGTGGQTSNGQEIHQDELKIIKIMYQLPFKTDMTKYQDQ